MKAWKTLLPLGILGMALMGLWVRSAPVERPVTVDPRAAATYGDLAIETSGGPLRLSDFEGKVVVVYFGYTSCPDICPTTLATMGQAFRLLSADEQEQLALLLVSVDPERDELGRLGDYARYFHPGFHGGSASPDRVAAMAADWGVIYRKSVSEGSAMAYTVDHSTQSFLVGRNGEMLAEIPHGTSPEVVAARLKEALTGNPARTSGSKHGEEG